MRTQVVVCDPLERPLRPANSRRDRSNSGPPIFVGGRYDPRPESPNLPRGAACPCEAVFPPCHAFASLPARWKPISATAIRQTNPASEPAGSPGARFRAVVEVTPPASRVTLPSGGCGAHKQTEAGLRGVIRWWSLPRVNDKPTESIRRTGRVRGVRQKRCRVLGQNFATSPTATPALRRPFIWPLFWD